MTVCLGDGRDAAASGRITRPSLHPASWRFRGSVAAAKQIELFFRGRFMMVAAGLIQRFCVLFCQFSRGLAHRFTSGFLSLPLSVWMCCLWAIIRVDGLVGGSL